jgi:hypothetical protein
MALRGEGGQEAALVAEVVCGRGMGDACAAGEFSEAHRGRTDLQHNLRERVEEGPAKVSMVVSVRSRR